MPKKAGRIEIGFLVSKEDAEKVAKLAKRRQFNSVGDYIRKLIEADTAREDEPIKFDVEWGGDRRPKSEP